MHHGYIGTEHVLFALARQSGTVAAETLARIRVDEAAIRARVEQVLGSNVGIALAQQTIPTARTKKVIEMSFRAARAAGSLMVWTDHLLLALLDEGEGIAAHVLIDLGATAALVRSTSEEVRSEGIDEGATSHAAPSARVAFRVWLCQAWAPTATASVARPTGAAQKPA